MLAFKQYYSLMFLLLGVILISMLTRVIEQKETIEKFEEESKDKDYSKRMIVLDQIDRLGLKNEDSNLKSKLLDNIMKDVPFRDKLIDTVSVKKQDDEALTMMKEKFTQIQSSNQKSTGNEEVVKLLKQAITLLETTSSKPSVEVTTQKEKQPKESTPHTVEGFEDNVKLYCKKI